MFGLDQVNLFIKIIDVIFGGRVILPKSLTINIEISVFARVNFEIRLKIKVEMMYYSPKFETAKKSISLLKLTESKKNASPVNFYSFRSYFDLLVKSLLILHKEIICYN